MMMSDRSVHSLRGTGAPAAPATVELVVSGELGPVLRSALRPQATARAERCTVLRLVAPESVDLLELVETLDSMGLSLTSVRVVL
jgi:hypothetical protein